MENRFHLPPSKTAQKLQKKPVNFNEMTFKRELKKTAIVVVYFGPKNQL